LTSSGGVIARDPAVNFAERPAQQFEIDIKE
jgi:hypothetical protein